MKFQDLNLNENLLKALNEMKFEDCTEVQERTFENTLNKKDVCVQSQTGTGKTGAFLISIFQTFCETMDMNQKTLVITPTRELAEQVYQEALKIGKYLDFSMTSVYGGVDIRKQIKNLNDNANIIIGTPGRIIDLASQNILKLKDINICVCDEADRMFDMGFYPDIQKIFKKMVPPTERQTYLFSATLGLKARQLAWNFMNDPVEIELNPEQITVDKINQCLYHVSRAEKVPLLIGLLDEQPDANCIIFTNTKLSAVEVALRLQRNDFNAEYIIGDMAQNKRQRIIDKVKKGKLPILVATDVAARGIHVDDLPLVINYDLPMHKENYVHRIGRTARAGSSGKAITFVCETFVYGLEAIEKYIEKKIDAEYAGNDLFKEDASQSLYFVANKRKNGGELLTKQEFYEWKEKASSHKKHRNEKRDNSKHKSASSNLPNKSKRQAQKIKPEKIIEKKIVKPRVANIKVDSSMSLDKRIEFYEQKYNEKFKCVGTYKIKVKEEVPIRTVVQKETFWTKIKAIFGK